MIEKEKLKKLYENGSSMMDISRKINRQHGEVVYWMKKYNIPRRSRSEAAYIKFNPDGDPFKIKMLKTKEDFRRFYLGIGLYLGEGDKKNKHIVKLANSDPAILRIFLIFLQDICNVKKSKIKAELNIFDDIDLEKALNFWQNATGLRELQFGKSMIRKSKGGSYKNKSKNGTLSIYILNTKLKKIINRWCKATVGYYANIKPR